jgi:hypothetical protein
MKDLCVVHLVRAHNDLDTLRRFLASYRANPGGLPHDLLVVFKGFRQPGDADEHRAMFPESGHEALFVSDEGFDITAYQAAIARWSGRYRHFCFLNSHSDILDPDWLGKLHAQAVLPGVGIAGATGSWNSHRSNSLVWFRGEVSSVARLASRPKRTSAEPALRHYRRVAVDNLAKAWVSVQLVVQVDPFPNPHVRTNAFVIPGELMESIATRPVRTKMDAYVFESGRKGLTRQTLLRGKRVLVVGRDGRGYENEEWAESRTFWRANQENLLVADNQTRDFAHGTKERRRYLASIAWGEDGGATHRW